MDWSRVEARRGDAIYLIYTLDIERNPLRIFGVATYHHGYLFLSFLLFFV